MKNMFFALLLMSIVSTSVKGQTPQFVSNHSPTCTLTVEIICYDINDCHETGIANTFTVAPLSTTLMPFPGPGCNNPNDKMGFRVTYSSFPPPVICSSTTVSLDNPAHHCFPNDTPLEPCDACNIPVGATVSVFDPSAYVFVNYWGIP